LRPLTGRQASGLAVVFAQRSAGRSVYEMHLATNGACQRFVVLAIARGCGIGEPCLYAESLVGHREIKAPFRTGARLNIPPI
jgi:hypothetical protein